MCNEQICNKVKKSNRKMQILVAQKAYSVVHRGTTHVASGFGPKCSGAPLASYNLGF